MKKYISKFHYLTQDLPHRSHIEQSDIACRSGANWIQYRCFSKTEEQMLDELRQIAAICDDWGATLLITDHYQLLDQVDAQGVHIEDMRADFNSIRKIIGEDRTLGASANSIDDIKYIAESDAVDYIGCGPFAHTDTKPNTYPILGVQSYRNLVSQINDLGISIPLIAVGGVTIADVDELISTGISGIAVSSGINLANEPGSTTKEFYRKVY